MELRLGLDASLPAWAVLVVTLVALAGLGAGWGEPAAASVTVAVGDNWFCASSFEGSVCDETINVGETVTWDYAVGGSVHTTTECGESLDDCAPSVPAWDSGTLNPGESFSHPFDSAGVFLYRCQVHPTEMRGRIVVRAATTPAPTPTPEPTPSASATPSPTTSPMGETPVGALPPSGGPSASGNTPALEPLAVGLGMVLVAASIVVLRSRKA